MNTNHAVRRRHDTVDRLRRTGDRLGAALLLVAVAPVLLACAIAIRHHDGGPVLTRDIHMRRDGTVGPGRRFRCTTLRSTTGESVRLTPAGRWMRRWGLDELPHLLDVVAGAPAR